MDSRGRISTDSPMRRITGRRPRDALARHPIESEVSCFDSRQGERFGGRNLSRRDDPHRDGSGPARRADRVGHLTPVHRLMHGESEQSLPVGREMLFEAFRLERRRFVEIRFAERIEQGQVFPAKIGVPGADFFKRRVVRRFAGGNRIPTEELFPVGYRIFATGQQLVRHPFDEGEVPQYP